MEARLTWIHRYCCRVCVDFRVGFCRDGAPGIGVRGGCDFQQHVLCDSWMARLCTTANAGLDDAFDVLVSTREGFQVSGERIIEEGARAALSNSLHDSRAGHAECIQDD